MADNPLGDFFISDADDELLEDDEPIVAAVVVPAVEAPAAVSPLARQRPGARAAAGGAGRSRRPALRLLLVRRHAKSGWRRRSTT